VALGHALFSLKKTPACGTGLTEATARITVGSKSWSGWHIGRFDPLIKG
jgi:hypothetical protein